MLFINVVQGSSTYLVNKPLPLTSFFLYKLICGSAYLFVAMCFLFQYPVYFAFEDSDIDAVLADINKNDAIGQPATATTGGYNCHLSLNISQLFKCF